MADNHQEGPRLSIADVQPDDYVTAYAAIAGVKIDAAKDICAYTLTPRNNLYAWYITADQTQDEWLRVINAISQEKIPEPYAHIQIIDRQVQP